MAEKKKKKKINWHKRYFLNPRRGRGHLIANVEEWEGCVNAQLEIGDCSRTIYLEFDWYATKNPSESTKKARLTKISRIIDTLVEMRDLMEKAEPLPPKKRKTKKLTVRNNVTDEALDLP